MESNQSFPDYARLDEALGQIIEGVPLELFSYLRVQFQNLISSALNKTVELKLKLVIDTSSVLPELMSFVKSGKSVFAELTKGDFLSIYAPNKLIDEVEEKIPVLSKRHKLNQASLYQAWNQIFRPKIKISEIKNVIAQLFGHATVGKREPFIHTSKLSEDC